MTIQKMQPERLKEALDLVWRVFSEFEAPEYSEKGIATFREFIELDAMKNRMAKGEIDLWYSEEDGVITGVIAMRKPSHISLLFVDKQHHNKGIAKGLVAAATSGHTTVTVHSSPYAVEIYKKLGFVPTDCEQLEDGIRYTPMVWEKQK